MLPIELPFTRFKLNGLWYALHVSEMRERERVTISALIAPVDDYWNKAGQPDFVPYDDLFHFSPPPEMNEEMHILLSNTLVSHYCYSQRNIESEIALVYEEISVAVVAINFSLEVDFCECDHARTDIKLYLDD